MYDIVLELRNVNHWFGRHRVLHDVNLRVVRGEIVALVGPSGGGKSTLLRAILGTHPPRDGQVLMNGEPVTSPGRDRGIVYQRYSLFPFLTARDNVAYGLMLDQVPLYYRCLQFWKWWHVRQQHREEAKQLLDKLRLPQEAFDRYPHELSGGMCQRVAIAQALIMKPQILLLDEPFGALDEDNREKQQNMLLELYDENLEARRRGEQPPYTIIMVTHELNEALYVSDRVVAITPCWRWDEEGLQEAPGATIVYDAASPSSPRDPVNRYDHFLKQRAEIRQVAFDPRTPPKRDEQYLRFWRECAEGKGAGVMKVTSEPAAAGS